MVQTSDCPKTPKCASNQDSSEIQTFFPYLQASFLQWKFQSEAKNFTWVFFWGTSHFVAGAEFWQSKYSKSSLCFSIISIIRLTFLTNYKFISFHQGLHRKRYICGSGLVPKNPTSDLWTRFPIVWKFQHVLSLLSLPDVQTLFNT